MHPSSFQFVFYLADTFPLQKKIVLQYAQKINWDSLVETLVFHRLAALVYFQISKSEVKSLFPNQVIRLLAECYAANLIDFKRQSKCVTQVFQELRRKHLPVVLFRGLDLSVGAYEDPGLRDMGDIDLVAAQKAMGDIRSVLKRQGWSANPLLPNIFSQAGETIDLHGDPFNLSRHHFRKYTLSYQPELISSEIKEGLISGKKYFRYSAELQFVLLAWHAQKHSYERANWLVDMAFLIRREKESFDFTKLSILASRLRLQKATAMALSFIQTHFPQIISQVFVENQTKKLNLIERTLLQRLIRGNFPAGGGVLLSAMNTANPLLAAAYLTECTISIDEIPKLFSRPGLKAYFILLAKRFRQMFDLFNHKK